MFKRPFSKSKVEGQPPPFGKMPYVERTPPPEIPHLGKYPSWKISPSEKSPRVKYPSQLVGPQSLSTNKKD